MSEAALRSYVKAVETVYRAGSATEHSYRPYLKQLLETFVPGIIATNEPKHIKNCGAPDFIVTQKQTPLGYVETKDIAVSLDQVERSDQMKRYLRGLANLILTDYIEFRWYVMGERRMTARLVSHVGGKGKMAVKWMVDDEGVQQVEKLLQGFLLAQAPTVNTPKELAIRMAAIAQLIRNAISQAFKSEAGAGSLHGQLQGFKHVLLPDLDSEQFADMYAQTICYGLFAARMNTSEEQFTREHAAYAIPKTNPFLRKMFGYIAGPDLDERIAWAVDDLVAVLRHTDMGAILRDFGKRTRQEDPVVHFYETFLAAYDPKLREARGVYYTPEPVVSYIVRSVDYLLKHDFGLPDGLADATKICLQKADGTTFETHKVQILDPATGTGTFLHSVIDLIHDSFKGNEGMWSGYVSQHLLPRVFGFELLMAPYTVAHMKLGLQLAETGYDFEGNERLGVYLTNTLEESYEGSTLPFAEWLVQEAQAADRVKHEAPVMVVIGNPPYSGHSANKGEWIAHLLHGKDDLTGTKVSSYFEVDGHELGEQNPKYLYDDYVKFIRFAQWRIEQTGYGILAFISNHGYLDNPTFRGMRQALMQSFDDIYVLDLHGNSKKKERSPDGSKDENVFDIQQGVAIGIFVKRKGKSNAIGVASVYHAELWGMREVFELVEKEKRQVGGKYFWLQSHDVSNTEWVQVETKAPFYLFVSQNVHLLKEFEQGWRLVDVMPINSTGVKTHRDHFVMDFDRVILEKRIVDFRNLLISDDILAQQYKLQDTRDWKLGKKRRSLAANIQWYTYFTRCLYRPFDVRAYFHHEDVVELPRDEVMRHMLMGRNLGFIFMRQVALQESYSHFLITQYIVDNRAFYSNKGTMNLAPLYLYPDPNKKDALFDTSEPTDAPGGRRPNLSSAFIADITSKLGLRFVSDGKGDLRETLGPEDIFDYMYAVFHSPTYRTRYAEFLKIDFPRLPLTTDVELFRVLCSLGARLVALHLMEQFGAALPSYPAKGNNVVEKVEYRAAHDEVAGRVYINREQYFDGVPLEVWEFHVGGYQVCQKWLKDRKGRTLSFEDIRHYQRIVAALAETITLMERIDEAIEEHGGWPLR
jgi:predicted helicase